MRRTPLKTRTRINTTSSATSELYQFNCLCFFIQATITRFRKQVVSFLPVWLAFIFVLVFLFAWNGRFFVQKSPFKNTAVIRTTINIIVFKRAPVNTIDNRHGECFSKCVIYVEPS
jgi:hypothetical protein